jgi:hypothetical protein
MPFNLKTVCKAACPNYAKYERDSRSYLGFEERYVLLVKVPFLPLSPKRESAT